MEHEDELYSSGRAPLVLQKKKKNTCISMLGTFEEFVCVGKPMGYNMEGCMKNMEDLIKSHESVWWP